MNKKGITKLTIIFLFACIVLGAVFIIFKYNDSEIIKIVEKKEIFYPIQKQTIESLSLISTTTSYFSVFIGKNGNSKILTGRFENTRKRIASITKLISAMVIKDILKDDDIITISRGNLSDAANFGNFKEKEEFFAKDLIKAVLVPSDNVAVRAFAEKVGKEDFASLMNRKALQIGMNDSFFSNPSGLDYQPYEFNFNYSTPEDVALAILFIKNNYPDLLSIMSKEKVNVCNTSGNNCRELLSTDKLLNSPDFPYKIIGAKTGDTLRAQKNLAMIIEAPESKGIIINVILDSSAHFADMTTLTNWVINSYNWK
ncbi:MAG: serine hydrolase [Minisyncoccia bacterium]